MLQVRTRSPESDNGEARLIARPWDPARAAVVICDMWDAHHCRTAMRRVSEMASRVNMVVSRLRAEGTRIVHAPGGCIDFYAGTLARARALSAPHVEPPAPIDWNSWNCDHYRALPWTLIAPGPCSCATAEPGCTGGPPYPWTRQHPAIDIGPADAVTEDGHELLNLLEADGVEDVLILGVHTNICVLGRPYGIRQLVFLGKRPLLCRDLTDSFHRDPHGHAWGTDQLVAHVERHWCPSVTSDQFIGGVPFQFTANEEPRKGSA